MKNAVMLLDDVKSEKLLVDPMRREILGLLSEGEMSEVQLARRLRMREPSIGHHLKLLRRAGLIRISRREVEEHGITQKFYEANALTFVIDYEKAPMSIKRYFYAIHLERLRGVLAALSYLGGLRLRVPTKVLEDLAEMMAVSTANVAKEYVGSKSRLNRESFIIRMYVEALRKMMKEEMEEVEVLREVVGKVRGRRRTTASRRV